MSPRLRRPRRAVAPTRAIRARSHACDLSGSPGGPRGRECRRDRGAARESSRTISHDSRPRSRPVPRSARRRAFAHEHSRLRIWTLLVAECAASPGLDAASRARAFEPDPRGDASRSLLRRVGTFRRGRRAAPEGARRRPRTEQRRAAQNERVPSLHEESPGRLMSSAWLFLATLGIPRLCRGVSPWQISPSDRRPNVQRAVG
jgi:hypothetical protein